MAKNQDEIRRSVLRDWREENERSLSWIARRTDYTRAYISHVMLGHYAFSDKLAQACIEHLGLDFGEANPEIGK